MNYVIPTTVLDNFFDDPLAVRRYALEQEFYSDPKNQWPGKRTKPLYDINDSLFRHTVNRFFSLFYFLHDVHNWKANAYFQLIDNSYKPWIHRDSELVTGVIYLDPEEIPNMGTTIFTPKVPGLTVFDTTEKQKLTDAHRLLNNNQFEESVVVKNKFNRLIAFDSKEYHSASAFEGERLTMVFFIEKLLVDYYPIQRLQLI